MATRPLDDRDARIVAAAPVFRGLSPEALAEVAGAARKVALRKGQLLFAQGAPADAAYLVLSGRARILKDAAEGPSVALRVLGPGDFAGVVAALGEDTYPVSVQAQQVCVAARWPGPALLGLMERHPKLALAALRMALDRLHELQEQHRQLATEKVERRVARALVRLVRQAGRRVAGGVRIDMPLTRQDVAELSGTTLFTASRILAAWGEAGILASRRGQVTVLEPHRLVALAEDLPPGSLRGRNDGGGARS